MGIGESIKIIRLKCLMNQTDFAQALGVSFSTVNRWENNKAIPNYKALNKLKIFCEKNSIPFDLDIEEELK